jgi:hypothetical protein
MHDRGGSGRPQHVMVLRHVVRGLPGGPEGARLCVDALRVVAGEVKARCGTSFYKNVCYPFVKMYDPEDSHNLSIKVSCAARKPLVPVVFSLQAASKLAEGGGLGLQRYMRPDHAHCCVRWAAAHARSLVLLALQAAAMGLVPYDNCKDHDLLATTGAHWLLHCHAPARLACRPLFVACSSAVATGLLHCVLPLPLLFA